MRSRGPRGLARLTAAIALASVGCDAPVGACPAEGARCGDLTPRPEPPLCTAGPARCELAPDWGVLGGTRLRGSWYVDDDGAALFAGMHDLAFDQACMFVELDGTARCVPPPESLGEGSDHARYFADASCHEPLLTAAQAARPHVSLGRGLRWSPPVEVYAPGPRFTGAAFEGFWWLEMQGGGGGGVWRFACVPASAPVPELHRAVLTAPAAFVAATPGFGVGTGRLQAAVLAATDGARVPVAVNRSLPELAWWSPDAPAFDATRGAGCAPVLDRCLPTPTVGVDGYPACNDGESEPVGGDSSSTFVAEACPGEPGRRSITRVATSTPCDASGVGSIVAYEPPSAFPRLSATVSGGPRLAVPTATDGADYCHPREARPLDTVLDVDCEPRMTSLGVRCTPVGFDQVGLISQVYRDPACTLPLRVAGCVDGACAWGLDLDDGAYYQLGPAGAEPLYVQLPGSCVSSSFPWFHLGPRAEASFARLTPVVR